MNILIQVLSVETELESVLARSQGINYKYIKIGVEIKSMNKKYINIEDEINI
jgi:hypothetical protein